MMSNFLLILPLVALAVLLCAAPQVSSLRTPHLARSAETQRMQRSENGLANDRKRSMREADVLDAQDIVRRKRDASENLRDIIECAKIQAVIEDRLKTNGDLMKRFNQEVELMGDSKFSLQLAWTGVDFERILIVTGEHGMSSVYLSDESGKLFNNITAVVEGHAQNADITLVKHPGDSGVIYLLANSPESQNSIIYISVDGGLNFKQLKLTFQVISSFIFHPTDPSLLLSANERYKDVHLSTDKGLTWKNIKSKVLQVKWSAENGSKAIYCVTTNETGVFSVDVGRLRNNVLEKSSDLGQTWISIFYNVYTFGSEGKFLYTSAYLPESRMDERFLVVSTDGGRKWNRAHVPTITPDRFYSILDSSEGQIFLHVDNPGDTGHGTLYTSDATGIIFSESLEHHLYPNVDDLTDFYRVESMRGVYIASIIDPVDSSIHTVVTFDRGGEWQSIKRPEGLECRDETQKCHLQIHNLYSIKRNIPANPPLSVPNAVGIILVHGHVAKSLQVSDPDVFVSSDGGYEWKLALHGPHHYQVADHGGLLVAVPADTITPNVVRFSTDEGRCWASYNYTDEPVVFTGLLVEPGNRAMVVAIWGYTRANRTWHTFRLNFTTIIDSQCAEKDYEDWTAHNRNGGEGCVLGSKEKFRRLKADSWCYNGKAYQVQKETTSCPCSEDDYDCDYGYHRLSDTENCVKEPTGNLSDFDICLRGHEQKVVPQGYIRIPGDRCEGGFSPPGTQFINLTELCTEDRMWLLYQDSKPLEINGDAHARRAKTIVVGLVVMLCALGAIVLVTFLAKKYRVFGANRAPTYRYSSIKCEEDNEALLESLRRNTSLYDDSESENDSGAVVPVSSTSSDAGGRYSAAQLHAQGQSRRGQSSSTHLPNGHAGMANGRAGITNGHAGIASGNTGTSRNGATSDKFRNVLIADRSNVLNGVGDSDDEILK